MWAYALQQRREGNSKFPLPPLNCIRVANGEPPIQANVKKEDGVSRDKLRSFSAPEHFYSSDIGEKVGQINRPMQTEKGRTGVCIVFKAEKDLKYTTVSPSTETLTLLARVPAGAVGAEAEDETAPLEATRIVTVIHLGRHCHLFQIDVVLGIQTTL